jgi:hypothetical protein
MLGMMFRLGDDAQEERENEERSCFHRIVVECKLSWFS